MALGVPGRVVAIGAAGVVALAAVIVVAVAGGGPDGDAPRGAGRVTLRVPPAGEAVPAYLDDGTPVFVAHLPSGEVRVFGAWSPHLGTKLLVWCETSALFEDLYHGSRFDLGGRWSGGPSPTGLVPFAAQVQGGVVAVGPRGLPPGREQEAGARDEIAGPTCGEDRLDGPARFHEPRDLAAVHDLIGSEGYRWTVVVASPAGADRTWLCAPERAIEGGCPDGSPAVPHPLEQGEQTLLVRGLGGDDVTVLLHAVPTAGG